MDKNTPQGLSEEELAYISRYLDGELGDEAQKAFEVRLAIDEVFRKQVAEVKALRLGIREANLAESLDDFHEAGGFSARSEKTIRKTISIRWWRWGAAAAVLVLFGVWKIWFSLPNNERLYQAYFDTDKGLPVEMSSKDTVNYMLYDGMISYKEGDYTDALAKWTQLANNSGYTDTLRYYIGMAQLNNDHVEEAIANLMEVVKQGRSDFHDRAVWYLALSYLKQGDEQSAISFLKRIRDDEAAQELLKKLE